MLHRIFTALALFAVGAQAHITLNPREAPATYSYHTIRVPHGCEGASTTSMTVTIPDGTSSIKPEISSDWTVSMSMRKLDPPIDNHGTLITETVDKVTYTFAFPVKNEFVFNAGLQMKFDSAATGGTVFYFPITQFCEDGSSTAWDELPDPETGARPAHPAPTVTIMTPDGPTGHEGHGDTAAVTDTAATDDAVDHSAHGHGGMAADASVDATLTAQSTHASATDDDDWTSSDTLAVIAVAIAVIALMGLAQMAFLYGKIQATLAAQVTKSAQAGTEQEPALAPSTCNC